MTIRQLIFGAGGSYPINPLPEINGATFTDSRFTPTASEVALIFKTDGQIDKLTTLNGQQFVGNWSKPTMPGIGASFWLKVDDISETNDLGAFTGYTGITPGTWYALSTQRQFTVSNNYTSALTYTVTATFSIAADSGGSNIVATGTCNLVAEGT